MIERAEWQWLPLQPVPFSASDSINVLGTNEFIEPAHIIIANVRQSRESQAVILSVRNVTISTIHNSRSHKHRRSQEFVLGADNRGVESAEIETPKASRGRVWGECPHPQS